MKLRDTYTDYGDNSRRAAKPRSRIMALTDLVMVVFTVIFAAALLCAYLARYVHPSGGWIFSFAALVAPVLYILNVIALLYWIIRWRLYVLIPAIAILVGINNVRLFFNPVFSKHYPEGQKTTTVISFNVLGFLYDDGGGEVVSSLDSVVRFLRDNRPDIVCIQEFQSRSTAQKEQIDSMLDMKYNVVNYTIENRRGGGWGTAIYSNFPIISNGHMNFDSSKNSSVWADIATPSRDTIRVFSNHLQTTTVSMEERDYISNQEFIQYSPRTEERVRGILGKLRRNYAIRAAQVDSLAPVIHGSPHKVLVCGDFNDTPMSYAYFKMRGGLKDSFVEKGQGINSNTFKGLFNIFRIDYILHSAELKAVGYKTPAIKYSDHKPVVVEFEAL